MKTVFPVLIIFVLAGCSFFEPSLLIVKNCSDYPIKISADAGSLREFVLEKGKGEFVMTPPGNLNLTVSIGEIHYEKTYKLKLEYLEKKKFDFNVGD